MADIRIGLVGDFNPSVTAHQAIPKAIQLTAEKTGCTAEAVWVATRTIPQDPAPLLADYNAIWCVPASPYENMEGALAAIRYARENGVPFLGTCGGFQHAILEYARHVLGFRDAEHAESDPESHFALIAPLSCSLVEKDGEIIFVEGSRLKSIYGVEEIVEQYHCNYGLNPEYISLFDQSPLRICGHDRAGDVRAMELDGHPFFFATLFQPERSALNSKTHPLISAYVAAAAKVTAKSRL
ncbi:MAG: CTP synthase [Anaerolineae bacterium]|nr:CTP synthase [Anaerolineae bacterium]